MSHYAGAGRSTGMASALANARSGVASALRREPIAMAVAVGLVFGGIANSVLLFGLAAVLALFAAFGLRDAAGEEPL